jgi:uncharacterized repeat protein (TIGR01451 family)/uncharacterized delta-60 repeat protein
MSADKLFTQTFARAAFLTVFALVVFAGLSASPVKAQSPLDSFAPNVGGTVFTVVEQPDGKILLGGSFSSINGTARKYIARLNPDGTLDTGFDPNPNGFVHAIAVQPDGKIVFGGEFFFVCPNGICEQPDGNYLNGYRYNKIARVNQDGTLDKTFNPYPDGGDPTIVRSIAIQSDGKILFGGTFQGLSPYGGGFDYHWNIARLEANGDPDRFFNVGVNGPVHSIAVQSDGGILLGGRFTRVHGTFGDWVDRNNIARLKAADVLGTGEIAAEVDQTFSPDANGLVVSFAVQPDRKILLGGTFRSINGTARNRIARVNQDGTLDTGFDPNVHDPYTQNVQSVFSIAVQSNGKILLGGSFYTLSPNGGAAVTRKNIARLNPDGTIDAAFDPNPNYYLRSIAIQSDGKILFGGFFTTVSPNGGAAVTRNRIARLVRTDELAPVSTASSPSAPNTSGWYNQDVSVSLSAADENGGTGVKQITFSASGAQTIPSTTVTADSAQVPSITSEGTTVISYYATDNAGNNETAQTVTIKLDKTAPSVQCGSVSTQWLSADASISCNSSDSVSGLESSTNASFTLTTAVPANTETNNASTDSRQVCDIAGNCSTAGPVTGNMIDKKSASISISSPLASTYQRNQLVTAQYSCADGGSGVATCSGPVASGSFIDTSTTGTKSFTVTSTDNVGNSSNQTITYTVVNNPPSGTPTADLSISMTDDAPRAGVETGSNITYTITLLNKGPNAATDVFISDEIPAGTSFVSATGDYTLVSGGTTGNKLVVNAGTLNSGDSVSITLVVKVNAASGSRINNSALASTSTFDSVTRNNTVTLSTKVSR